MMKTFHALALAAALALPAAANGNENENENAADQDEVVCKNTFVLGSKIPTRVCHTRQEWSDMEAEQREQRRRHGSGSSRCSGDARC